MPGTPTVSRRLRMEFELESEDKRTITVPNPKATLDASAVDACMTALVESGDAFADPLKKALKGETIVTTTTVLVDNTSNA